MRYEFEQQNDTMIITATKEELHNGNYAEYVADLMYNSDIDAIYRYQEKKRGQRKWQE